MHYSRNAAKPAQDSENRMSSIVVTTRAGNVETIEASPGTSVMELIRGAGIEDIAALCGGTCSCATCHVYVAEQYLPLLAAADPMENDMLEGSSRRAANSRLSCQLMFEDRLDGLEVAIAPED